MNPIKKRISVILLAFMFLIGACRANVSRNSDGSRTVETSITQQELQDAITASIADPLVQSITVTLESGYVSVSGKRQRLNDTSKTDVLSFRLDLGVSNGQLTSAISEALLDGKSIEQARVDNWNQTIANRITKLGSKNPNAVLQSVNITTDKVTMIWIVQ